MSEQTCRWNGSGNPRLLKTHANADCPSTCEGCQPCEANHCGVCGRTHVGTELTCPACVGAVRDDLSSIRDMSTRLLREAIVAGVNSEAANLAGPVADPEAWSWRKAAARRGVADHVTVTEGDESTHPAWVLGTWEMLIREHLVQPSDDLLSIESAGAYLDGHLTNLANDGEFAFEEMARDLRKCRVHLEDVLCEGEREERGEKCHNCGTKRLVKDYGKTPDSKVMWRCPGANCQQSYTEAEYIERVETRHIDTSPELTLSHMAKRLGYIEASTMRRWAGKQATGEIRDGEKVYAPPLLKPCGKDASKRKLYRVADVEALWAQGGRMAG